MLVVEVDVVQLDGLAKYMLEDGAIEENLKGNALENALSDDIAQQLKAVNNVVVRICVGVYFIRGVVAVRQ